MVTLAVLFLGFCLTVLIAFEGTEACAELTLTEKEGEVSSPNFPQQYFPNTCTIWTIQKPISSAVTISFRYLDLPQEENDGRCHSNYIQMGLPGRKTTICGRQTEAVTGFPGGREFTIKFISGPIPLGQGFRLDYFVGPWDSERCAYDQFRCNSGKCIPGHWKCNGRRECRQGDDEQFCYDTQRTHTLRPLTERPTTFVPGTPQEQVETCYHQLFRQEGNFSMPPHPFQDFTVHSCTWHIYKPYAGSYIHLLISNVSLQSGEAIKVYDGHSNLAPRLALVRSGSHRHLPISVRSSGSHMLVQFTTTEKRNYSASRWVVFTAKYHFEDQCILAGETPCGSKDNKCFRPLQRCDGVWDCPLSGTDEEKCYGCPEHSFSCGSFGNGLGRKKCYFRHDRCSGVSVCPNDADELNCNEQLCSESRDLFLCANKRCIRYSHICDETDNCGDFSDEEGCNLGNSRKVIVAAVVGSLLCSLLLVLSLGCACKFYYLRHHHHHHHHHRGPRYDTPLSRLQAEMFRRRAPPPPYHEAMLTSRPYDEAVREYLAQNQQTREPEAAEQRAAGGEHGDSGNDSSDQSVQNLISLMDFSEQGEEQLQTFNEHSSRLELHIPSDTSSDSDSDEEEDNPHGGNLVEDDLGQIEMTENLSGGSSNTQARAESLRENISEDSASATLSGDGTEMTSLAEEGGSDTSQAEEESSPPCRQGAEESDKENSSDADSVCILCLDEDPAALDDGSDTRCLLQDL